MNVVIVSFTPVPKLVQGKMELTSNVRRTIFRATTTASSLSEAAQELKMTNIRMAGGTYPRCYANRAPVKLDGIEVPVNQNCMLYEESFFGAYPQTLKAN
jgi:hypothetical protein